MSKVPLPHPDDPNYGKVVDLLSRGPLLAKFPFTYSDKSYTWEEISVDCPECSRTIPSDLLFGSVCQLSTRAAHVHGVGYCVKCNLLGPVDIWLYSDGSVRENNNQASPKRAGVSAVADKVLVLATLYALAALLLLVVSNHAK